jgi:hypothetical protein
MALACRVKQSGENCRHDIVSPLDPGPGAAVYGVHSRFIGTDRETGERHQPDGRAQCLSNLSSDVIAVQPWKTDVNERDIRPNSTRHLDAAWAIRGDMHLMPSTSNITRRIAPIRVVPITTMVGMAAATSNEASTRTSPGAPSGSRTVKLAAPARPITLDGDGSAVQLYQIPNDRQAKRILVIENGRDPPSP